MIDAAERIRTLLDLRGEIANRDVVRSLRVSSATAHRLLSALVVAGVLELRGKGRAARYRYRPIRLRFARRGLEEDRVWRELAGVIQRTRPLGEADLQSLQYAATETINNAVDHSRGHNVEVRAEFGVAGITTLTVRDDGIGVYRRICDDFDIPSAHEAIVRLEKGKLTSDPARHSGEGLFFSSKAVSRFRLESRGTAWLVDNLVGDRAIAPSPFGRGTLVTIEVVPGRTPRLSDVFSAYSDPESLRFDRTRASIKLSAFGATLVSRSEAKRLLADLTKFRHVTLDFSGVDVVGQGFCDEVFRIFARAHPGVALEPVGANEAIAFMVARARRA